VGYTAVGQTVKIPFLFRRNFPLKLHESGRLQRISGRQSCDFQQTQYNIPWLAMQNCKEMDHKVYALYVQNVSFYAYCIRIYLLFIHYRGVPDFQINTVPGNKTLFSRRHARLGRCVIYVTAIVCLRRQLSLIKRESLSPISEELRIRSTFEVARDHSRFPSQSSRSRFAYLVLCRIVIYTAHAFLHACPSRDCASQLLCFR